MPIYEFACADCGHEFESLQRLNEAPPAACPKCGQGSISKKISAAGFRLKGGGWYETDFKNKNKSKDKDKDKDKAETKSDSGSADSGSADSTASTDSSTPKPSESASGSSE